MNAENNLKVKILSLKEKLWFNIFLKVGAIFFVFVLVVSIANSSLLSTFFTHKQKKILKNNAEEILQTDISDNEEMRKTISRLNEKYNVDIEIYSKNGQIVYTTHGSQMMDYFAMGNLGFSMAHEKLKAYKSETLSNGMIIEHAIRPFDETEFMLCRANIDSAYTVEVSIQKNLITSSASIAGEFITIIAVICFFGSIVWIYFFAKIFSKPLTSMNEIARDMANQKFDRKLQINRKDEIGQLAVSINEMSDSLSEALSTLKEKNIKLTDEIEAERRLDVMRRGFVANVSHELKTPISIISGYAEGLKLNINEQSRAYYCDTIIDESKRMNKLVLSILELSKYESGEIPQNREIFDINPFAEEMLTRIFSSSDINVINNTEPKTFVNSDKVQTEQMLKSYLENAKSHTDNDGVVTVSSQEISDKIRISVENTGSHIDAELMPQIWQSFFRGDSSHKREQSRFGLGLSIVNAICKMNDCDCGVYNTGKGVCFWFDIPKAETQTEQ